MSDTVIVIPVRGGSVGIPCKALRPLGETSPLLRIIETAKQLDADVVVTTDDEEIADMARSTGIVALEQPPEVSHAMVSLDAPVHWATVQMEQGRVPYAIVVTMQCTSPFTTPDTVRQCIEAARTFESAVTVRDDRGLRWHATLGTHLSGMAPYRVVRQQMSPEWRETGAVLASQRRHVTPSYRFGHTVHLIEVSGREAVDLDTPEDWWIAERYAEQEQRQVAA